MKNILDRTMLAGWLLAMLSLLFLTGATTLTDPTRPPDILIPAAKKLLIPGSMQLTAVFIYPDRRFAVINGHSVSVGEKIGEYTIINIQHDTVELKGLQDSSKVLTLLPSVKRARVN